jgi:hypothetical protein
MCSNRRFAIAMLIGVLCSFGCMCGMCGGCASRDDVEMSMKRADKSWDENRAKDPEAEAAAAKDSRKAAAVAEYKKLYDERLVEKAEKAKFLTRIVEFEIGNKNTAEAKRWIERGVADGIEVEYTDAKAKEMLAVAKDAREKRQAELAAAKEADRKAKAESSRRGKRRPEAPDNGGVGYIEMEGQSVVWVAINEQADKELTAFSIAKNEDAVKQMMAQGRVLVCAKRTRVSVVDRGFFSTTIRIMDGKHAGATGVIPNDFLYKGQPPEDEAVTLERQAAAEREKVAKEEAKRNQEEAAKRAAREEAERPERERREAAERPERERREAAELAERERKAEADRTAIIEKDAATMLRLARNLYDGGDKAKAQREFEKIIVKFPNTKTAEEAKKLLKTLY